MTDSNPQAANPNAPAEVVIDPSDPNYLEQRRQQAANEAREGQEAAARLRENSSMPSAVITATGVVTNPGEVAEATPQIAGGIGSPAGTSGVGGVTVSESVNTTRTTPESGTRRTK